MSIVININLKNIFPEHSLFAINAEALAEDRPGAPLKRLDRVGRPEITNVSLFSSENNQELRDLYNLEDAFVLSEGSRHLYKSRLRKNIKHYDALDNSVQWQDQTLSNLTERLSYDYLIFDSSKPCSPNSFFEIEKAFMSKIPHETCGGRTLDSDIMDILYSLYIGGLNGVQIRDGIDKPSQALLKSFPYLAAPDLSAAARLKASLGRRALGL